MSLDHFAGDLVYNRSSQPPSHPRHAHFPHSPQLTVRSALSSPHPRDIDHREVCKHPDHGRPVVRQHIDAVARRREQVALATDLDAVGDEFHGVVDGSFVQEMLAGRADVESVHGARLGRVPFWGRRNGDVRRHDDFAGGRVGEVERLLIGRESDAIRLRQCVFDQSDMARVRVEAISAHVDLGWLVVDAVRAAIVCRHSEKLGKRSCSGPCENRRRDYRCR